MGSIIQERQCLTSDSLKNVNLLKSKIHQQFIKNPPDGSHSEGIRNLKFPNKKKKREELMEKRCLKDGVNQNQNNPITIPIVSRLGHNTYLKYLESMSWTQNPNMKEMAIEQIKKKYAEIESLRMRSEAKDPPTDEKGNIIPPKNFKSYDMKTIEPMNLSRHKMISKPKRIDMFGKIVPQLDTQLLYWKLSYKWCQSTEKRILPSNKERDPFNLFTPFQTQIPPIK